MQEQVNQDIEERDDDFGLPAVNYSPIEREDNNIDAFEPAIYYADHDGSGIKQGWLVILMIGLFSGMFFAFYLFQ